MTRPPPLPVGKGIEERRKRIAEIRRAITEGRYRVPAERVADAILERLRRGRLEN